MMTFKQYLSGLNIIQASLVIGLGLFMGVVLFLHWGGWSFAGDQQQIFLPIVLMVAVGGFSLAMVLGGRLTNKAAQMISVHEKLNQFRIAIIVRGALLEGPSLLALVIALLTAHWMYLIVTIVGMVLLSNNFITVDRLRDRLHFTPEQSKEIDRPEFRI